MCDCLMISMGEGIMKIDYFCFSVPSLGTTDYSISENDDENTVWIKTKEQELMDAAKVNNMLMVFDRNTKKFYVNSEEIEIKGKVVFPRSFISAEEELLNKLEENGALSIQTKEDLDKIINWPQKIQPVHRKIIQTTYEDFQNNAEKYKSIFKKIFFKTREKSHTHCVLNYFGYIDLEGKKYFVTKPTLWNISLEDSVFLTQAFESIEDKENNTNCKEYRAFILDNTLLSISRSYVDYPVKVPDKVRLFVEEQINKVSFIRDFPKSYVLDIGQVLMDDREVIDIIEFNPISSSGLEVCNNLVGELLKKESTAVCKKVLIKK